VCVFFYMPIILIIFSFLKFKTFFDKMSKRIKKIEVIIGE